MKYKDIVGCKNQQPRVQEPVQNLRDKCCTCCYAEDTSAPSRVVFSLRKFEGNTDKIYLEKWNETLK